MRLLEEAASGLSEMSWAIGNFPLRSWLPFPCLRFPWCLSSLDAFLYPGSSQPGRSRLHGTVDAVVAHGEARMLHRDASGYLLRGPALVAHEPHGQGAPLRIVHEPGTPAAQPSRIRAPLRGRCAVNARQRCPEGPCHPLRLISREMVDLSLPSSLAIWLTPSWPFQRTMMSSRSAMPRWL